MSSMQNAATRVDGKDPISLALGDPTASGEHFSPCPVALASVHQALVSPLQHAGAGYISALGLPGARDAIAKHYCTDVDINSYRTVFSSDNSIALRVESDQVLIASGCSGALELAFTALLDEGSVILVPKPGFPLYQVIAESHGATILQYNLDPNRNWEIDLDYLEKLLLQHSLTTDIRGIVVNNPGNPTGSVFSRSHLEEIVRLCNRFHLPIVADEVYGNLTYKGNEFVSLAAVSTSLGQDVPVIVASGLSKQYLLPGWRVGWLVFCDNKHHSLAPIERGAKQLAQVILGASHLPQTAISALLDPNNKQVQDWKQDTCNTLERHVTILTSLLIDCPGLEVCSTAGAMYLMVRLNLIHFSTKISSDVEFCSVLLEEENVALLPGTCFGAPGFVRLVFCAAPSVLTEAAQRIVEFCHRYVLHANSIYNPECAIAVNETKIFPFHT